MKGFTKAALIVALVLVILGSMLCAVGMGVGFRFSDFWDQVEAGEFSIGPIKHIPFIRYGNTGVSWDGWDDWDNGWDSWGFGLGDGKFDWDAQDKEGFSFSWKDVNKIELDLDYSGVNVIENSAKDAEVQVDVEYRKKGHNHKVEAYMDGGTLKIKESGRKRNVRDDSSRVDLQIPTEMIDRIWLKEIDLKQGKGYIYVEAPLTAKEISIKVGAGECEVINKLTAQEEMVVSVDAGEMSLEELEAKKLKLGGGVGELTVGLIRADTIEIDGGVGEIEVTAAGKETDYSYDVNCGVGSVEIGDHEYSGLSSGGTVQNAGDKKIDIDCGVGSVEVSFQEQ